MCCSFLALGLSVYSQQGPGKNKATHSPVKKGVVTNVQSKGRQMVTPPTTLAAFWSDDFSVKTNWTMTAQAGAGQWKIDTLGPQGSFKITPINSTTHSNGFATFDSDLDCSGNQIADLTNATAINCSAHNFIALTFQEQYRRYIDSTFIFVSNNGTTWTKYPVNVALAVNDFCATNPTLVKLDISAVAGGKATVWVRFEFYSPSTLGTGSGCSYSWMVDDVALTDIPANDLSLDMAYADFGYQGGGYYTQTPISEIVPMTFRAAISNQGTATQTNNKLKVDIRNASSSVFSQTGPIHASLSYAAKDTLFDTLPAFTPAALAANYTARFEISQTQVENPADTMNNSVTKMFSVSDTVFARDNGMTPIASTIGSVNYTNGDADGSMIANLFQLPMAATVTSISAFIDTSSAVGTQMQYVLVRLDSAGNFNTIASSTLMNITSKGSLGRWITLPVRLPVVPGSYFAAVLANLQVSTTTPPSGVMIGVDKQTQQPIQTSYLYAAGNTTWGYITQLPMIRLNILAGSSGIKENSMGMSLISAYPNPASQTVAINYTLDKTSDVLIQITDISGKNMGSVKEASVMGQHSAHLDLGGYAAGTYFYTLTTSFGKLSGKFVVIK